MPTLSLAMIVKDEEKNLGQCLQSVQGCFDEIVIVDTGSKDKTKEVAQSFGSVIHDFEWIDDFSAARNFAFSKATCDYVMWLDADDILKPEDRKRLQDLRYKLDSADAYAMRYDTARDEFGNPTSFFTRIRIVRNTGEARWDAPIHEVLVVPNDWKHGLTNIVVTHNPSAEDIAHDPGRNIRLLRKAVEARPSDLRLKYYLARELSLTKGGDQEAIARFEDYLRLDAEGQNRVNAWLLLGICCWRSGNEEKAINCCLKGIQLDPRWAEFYVTIGQIYCDQKDWKKAIHWFEAATRCTVPESWGIVLYDNYTWVPWDRLCVAYWQVGERQKSYEANERALAYRPMDQRLVNNREVMRNLMCNGRVSDSLVRLNLGATRDIPGYRTCYPLPGPGVQEVFDINNIYYGDSTVHSIYCDRSLENLNGQEARDAFKEWARVLRYNGELILRVTDLDLCCEGFIREEDRDPVGKEGVGPKEWFRHAIYGISKAGARSSEKRTSFTKAELRRLLEANGFEIASFRNCDLDNVPSIEVRAYLKRKPMKVSWLIASSDGNGYANRIRRIIPHRYVETKGVESKLFEKAAWEGKDDALFVELKKSTMVVLTECGETEKTLADRLRKCGIPVVFDLSADVYERAKLKLMEVYLNKLLQSVSLVVCASPGLASNFQNSTRTSIIPDSYELSPEPLGHSYDPHGKSGRLRVVWCGPAKDMANLDPIRQTVADLGMELVAISDGENADRKLTMGSWLKDLNDADVAIFPEAHWVKEPSVKSNFWVTQAQAIGLPVLASPIQAYKETVEHEKTGYICESIKDWKKSLSQLAQSASLRESLGRAAKVEVRKRYAIDRVAEKWMALGEMLSLEMAAPPKVDIIIPTYNNLKSLKACIESVRGNTYWPYNMIVVDSGNDETHDWLKAQPDITFLKSPEKLNFSAATSAGIKVSKEKYLVTLNNETIVAEGWLSVLMHEAMKPGAREIGPFSGNERNWLYVEPTMLKTEIEDKKLTVPSLQEVK